MKDYLKAYEIVMTTLSPVFVGSGHEYAKKEYLFLSDNRIGILDMQKLCMLMKTKGISEEFEKYYINDNKTPLDVWVNNHGISETDIYECTRYIISRGDNVLSRKTRTQIMEHIKDPYENPYIPGSSIKGMLKTIILSGMLIENGKKYDFERNSFLRDVNTRESRTRYMKRNIANIETKAFNTLGYNADKLSDSVNSNMSGLIVGDSDALSNEQMVLCQKIDRHTDGTEKRLNLLRECIKPGTEIRFVLTLDETRFPLGIEEILEYIDIFDKMYYESFVRYYKGMECLSQGTVFLGGGTGYLTKTITYPLLGYEKAIDVVPRIFENSGVSREHKHYMDKRLKVSPHILKMTKFEGRYYQMGMCNFRVKGK